MPCGDISRVFAIGGYDVNRQVTRIQTHQRESLRTQLLENLMYFFVGTSRSPGFEQQSLSAHAQQFLEYLFLVLGPPRRVLQSDLISRFNQNPCSDSGPKHL